MVRKYKFPVLNISQFYPRPGTPAAKMKLLPTQVVKSRSRAMTQLFESYTNYDALIGTIQPVKKKNLANFCMCDRSNLLK